MSEKQTGPGRDQTPSDAAARRAAHIAALEDERRGYEVRGLTERAKQVDGELKRLKGAPKGRRASESTEA